MLMGGAMGAAVAELLSNDAQRSTLAATAAPSASARKLGSDSVLSTPRQYCSDAERSRPCSQAM